MVASLTTHPTINDLPGISAVLFRIGDVEEEVTAQLRIVSNLFNLLNALEASTRITALISILAI